MSFAHSLFQQKRKSDQSAFALFLSSNTLPLNSVYFEAVSCDVQSDQNLGHKNVFSLIN